MLFARPEFLFIDIPPRLLMLVPNFFGYVGERLALRIGMAPSSELVPLATVSSTGGEEAAWSYILVAAAGCFLGSAYGPH